jgi:hypothetical protein
MIYDFKNRKSFFEIKLFILARTFDNRLPESSNSRSSESKWHRNPATSGHWNIAGARIRRHLVTVAECRLTRFRPWSKACQIWPKLSDLAKMARIRPDLTGFGQNVRDPKWISGQIWPKWPDPAGIRQRRLDVAGFRQQLHFHLS